MKRARRAGLRASRTLRRLPLRGKLILGGALTLFVAFMIAGAVLLSRGGNAKAAEQARDVNVGGVAALALSQGAPEGNVQSIDITPPPTPSLSLIHISEPTRP